MAHGFFIALEGIDGAGTTSQLRRLAVALSRQGHMVLPTAQPSRGPIGRLIRRALRQQPAADEEALALLFAADRRWHLTQCIEPALATGHVVICDRYLMSSYAYQGTRLDLTWVQQINCFARAPDATLFFEVPPFVAEKRRSARGLEADHFESTPRQKQVAAAYLRFVRGPQALANVYSIDAEAPVDQVCATSLACIAQFLPAATASTEATDSQKPCPPHRHPPKKRGLRQR